MPEQAEPAVAAEVTASTPDIVATPEPMTVGDMRPTAPPQEPLPTPTAADDAGEPETLFDYEPAFESLLVEEGPRRAWPWVLGTLLALSALAVQAAIHFRVELAVLAPETRPALRMLCDYAGCDLPLPRKV